MIKNNKNLSITKILIILILILILILTGIVAYKKLSKKILLSPTSEGYEHLLGITTDEDIEYNWKLENKGQLKKISISGNYKGEGTFKIYLIAENETFLISENQNLSDKKLYKTYLTGLVIDTNESNQKINEDQNISKINSTITKNESQIQENNTSEYKNDSNKKFSDNKSIENNLSPIKNKTLNESIEDEISNETISDIKNFTKETQEIKEFNYECKETCDLSRLNLIQEQYILKIIVNNITLNLEKINYEIIKEQKPNISEEIKINFSKQESIQYNAIINQEVKWIKIIEEKNISKIELPKEAKAIKIKLNEEVEELKKELESNKQSKKNIITGYVIEENSLKNKIKETEKEKILDLEEIIKDRKTEKIAVEYYTEGPKSTEIEIENGKLVKIYAPDEINYSNILAFTTIPEILSEEQKENIRVYWREEKKEINFEAFDKNKNGKIDYIEWIVPHLSNQTFEITIKILNVQSYPMIGGNWTVEFETIGKSDLKIRPINGTTWSDSYKTEDLKFLKVMCGNTEMNYQIEGEYVIIKDYECFEKGIEKSLVLTGGKHHLEFEFGGIKDYAHNYADVLTIEWGKITNVGESWTTVNLEHEYINPVIIATYNLPSSSSSPAVTRIREIDADTFQVKIQRASTSEATPGDVHYIVIEEGSWILPNGDPIEAHRYTSTTTARKGNWIGEYQIYSNSYTNPVVLGQVMSYNDVRWSVFWNYGDSITNPPSGGTSGTSFYTGKHIAEDIDINRVDETIGYIILEQKEGDIGGIKYKSGLGGDIIQGVGNSPPYSYSYYGYFLNPEIGIISQSAMDGGDGGWAVLYGNSPLSGEEINLAIDEDLIGDTERSHTTEQVGVIVFETSGSYTNNFPPNPPTDINCGRKTDCNIQIDKGIELQAFGATDPEGDEITSYVIEANIQGNINSLDQEQGEYQITGFSGVNILGETGEETFSVGDTSTHSITFSNNYESIPVIIASPVTENSAFDNYIIPVITDITNTGFNLRLCIDAGATDCAAPEAEEKIHYFVFDIEATQNYDWIEVGTKQGVITNGGDTEISFSKSFTNTPLLFVQSQTYNQAGNQIAASAWVDDITTTKANIQGCTHQGTGNSCDSRTPSETFGWVAIDSSLVAFENSVNFQSGIEIVNNDIWSPISWNPTYTNPRLMTTIQGDSGGQDPKYPWGNIISTNPQVRQCEQDGYNDCDNHNTNPAAWFTIEQGNIIGTGSPNIESTKEWNTYGDIFSDSRTGITNIQVTISVSNYDNSGSSARGNINPDLQLEMWDGTQFIYIGNFLVNGIGDYILTTSNPTILSSWENQINTDLRIRGINFDYFDSFNIDKIYYDSVIVTMDGAGWIEIGNHTPEESFFWDTSFLDEQDSQLRAKAIDSGSGGSSDYSDIKGPITISRTNQEPSLNITALPPKNPVIPQAGSETLNISFEIEDFNGAEDINKTTSYISYSEQNSQEERNISLDFCSFYELNPLKRIYNCTIEMYYYDSPGDWKITIYIEDKRKFYDINDSEYFTIPLLRAISLEPESINFPQVTPGDVNIFSSITNITNEGNFKIPENSMLQITPQALIGQNNNLQNISGNNFKVSGSITDVCSNGIQLQEDIPSEIQGITLPKGSEIELFPKAKIRYCMTEVPKGLFSQDYSTQNYLPWEITIVTLMVTVLPARRKKRKIKDEKLIQLLDENIEDILNLIKENKIRRKIQNIKIPLNIFKEKISPAEAVAKYLRENKELKFSEIAIALGRNQRTIWINYRNASKKKKDKIQIKKEVYSIPINVFSIKNLSILESVVKYLKDSRKSNLEIGRLLNKNPNNIWTINKRIERKLKNL